VLAHSITDKYSFKQIDFEVKCVLESQMVMLSSGGTLTIEVDKNLPTIALLNEA